MESPTGPDVPDYFKVDKLTKVLLDQIVWWDETHKKVLVGRQGVGSVDFQIQFYRDENGKLDLEGGTIDESKRMFQMKFKYDDEARFCLGCAMVESDGDMVGVRCEMFDYTGKLVDCCRFVVM